MGRKKIPVLNDYMGEKAQVYERRRGLKRIKTTTTTRALELLDLEKKAFILDIGCGTGWSTEIIKNEGHIVIGLDLSKEMIKLAQKKGFETIIADMRYIGIKSNYLDGSISISALNFVAEKSKTKKEVRNNYTKVASEIFRILKPGGRAIFEYYPQSDLELKISTQVFSSVGFLGGLIIDGVGTRKEQKFLVLEKPKKK
ncbi:MAG: class I SAM-dependent methyltransferase [Candidatus Heimdallarchaeota archaeon]